MKTNVNTLAALFLLLCTVSCQKDNAPLESPKRTVDMHIIASHNDNGTRTFLVEEDGSLIPKWSIGDKLQIHEILYSKYGKNEWEGELDYPTVQYESSPCESEGATADFSVELQYREKEAGEQYHYIAVYPANWSSFCNWTGDEYYRADWAERWSGMAPEEDINSIPPHPTVVVEIPVDQHPVPGQFDPNADVLVSDILSTDTQPESINIPFARVGAIFKVNFTGLPEGFQPDEGVLECGESWPAAYMMEYDPYLHKVGLFTKPSNCIRFNLCDYPQCDGSTMTVWLRTISGAITDWFRFTINGYVGEEKDMVQMKFEKYVDLNKAGSTLQIPESKVTEIDVALLQGFIFDAFLTDQTPGETSFDATVCYNVSGPEITSIEYGVYYTEGQDYEGHSTSWQKVVLTPDESGNAILGLTGLKPDTYYSIAPYALINGQMCWCGYNEVIQTLPHYEYAQPEAVDLGLPSGLKWASFNLGATKASEAGYHFAWAETVPRKASPGYSYSWYAGGYTKYTSAPGVMDIEDDAARVNLADGWRIPSADEWVELKYNCTWAEETLDNVEGYRVTSSVNGNSIFFPYAGFATYNYGEPENVGTKAGMMTSSYTTSNNCWEVIMPWDSSDYSSRAMMQTLLSVRPVK